MGASAPMSFERPGEASRISAEAGAVDGLIGQSEQDPWVRLANETDEAAFMDAWLSLTCAAMPGLQRGVAFLAGETETLKPVARWAQSGAGTGGQPDLTTFAETASRLLDAASRTGQGTLEQTDSDSTFAAYPFVMEGTPFGGVVVLADGQTVVSARRLLRHLQWSQAWVEAHIRRSRAGTEARLVDRARTILDMVAIVAPRPDFKDACRVFAGALASDLGAERVSAGFTRRKRCHLVAISQVATFERAMQMGQAIEAAMDEAVDQEQALLYQTEGAGAVQAAAHQALAREGKSRAILTVPLPSDGEVVGAVSIERTAGGAFTQADVDLA
ncbi:MAG: GAF domain-containing protein, partial [Pseudomonadota bacterium]